MPLTPAEFSRSVTFNRVGQNVIATACVDTPHGKASFNTSVALQPLRAKGEKLVREQLNRRVTRDDRNEIEDALEDAARQIAARQLYSMAIGQWKPVTSEASIEGWSVGSAFDWGNLVGGGVAIIGTAFGQPEVALASPIISSAVDALLGIHKDNPKAIGHVQNIKKAADKGDPMSNQALGVLKALAPLIEASTKKSDDLVLTKQSLPNGNVPVVYIRPD